MDRDNKAPIVRRRILKAVRESLAEKWDDPFWAQLEDAELDARSPLIDIQDRDDHYLLVAELPGIPKDKVDVKVHENMVEVTGENVLECELGHEDLAYLCNERSFTNFHRKVPLPNPVLPNTSEANMENGVLVIKLPKKVETEEPTISLKVG
jgi:HSP20 family protein